MIKERIIVAWSAGAPLFSLDAISSFSALSRAASKRIVPLNVLRSSSGNLGRPVALFRYSFFSQGLTTG